MSKITFRADDDLVDELECFDASKSEVMREALRTYLEGQTSGGDRVDGVARNDDHEAFGRDGGSFEGLVREIVREEVGAILEGRSPDGPTDVSVTVELEGVNDVNASFRPEEADGISNRQNTTDEHQRARETRKTADLDAGQEGTRRCGQCGQDVDGAHVYCPNCGEKATRRVFCECGEEIRSDWAFCAGCGRRTPAADVLESR